MYESLGNVSEENKAAANQIKQNMMSYIHDVMLPKLLHLQFFIVASSFLHKGKPIIDLFYTNVNKKRVMRGPVEFS